MYDHRPRSIGQRSRSQADETYEQLERYNSETESRVNFKLGEIFIVTGKPYDTLSVGQLDR